MRRLALIIGQLEPPGGGERDLVNLALGLSRRRWRPEVLCLSEKLGPFGERLRSGGVPVRTFPSSGHRDWRRLLRLAAALRREDYAIGHSWLPPDNVYHRLAALAAPSLLVMTTCLTSQGSPEALNRRLESWAYRTSDRVLTNSEAGRDFLIQSERVSPGRIRLVPQGIDFSPLDRMPPREEARTRLGLPAGAVIALFLGWFRPEKNLGLLVEAASRLRRSQPRLHWCLVGEGEERETLQRRIDAEGLAGAMTLPGRREDLPTVFAAADLFVLSSDFEGLPGALLEALGAGLPAVVTRVGDCQALVEACGAGRVVPPGDAEAFSRGVAELAEDPGLREGMGGRGRDHVRRSYGVAAMVRATEAVYEEALRG